jgi:hypothetical protein
MPQLINTRSAERRSLSFTSLDDVLADVERIVAAEKGGTLRRTGNWAVGQTFGHLAAWINYAYEGYPMRVPWFIRWLVQRQLRKMLKTGMTAGVRIPKAEAGTYGVEPLSTDDGAARLRAALGRLKRGEPARFDSPAFGPATLEQRIQLNLRHAELHLGFLHP